MPEKLCVYVSDDFNVKIEKRVGTGLWSSKSKAIEGLAQAALTMLERGDSTVVALLLGMEGDA